MRGISYRFTHAIARAPGASVIDGLRAEDRGAPDFQAFQAEHGAYLDALRGAGVAVTVLPALEPYPDSVFIEDAAICFPQGAVITRPGAASRLGEADEIGPALNAVYADVRRIEKGFLDGGDVLATETEILVGRSERTDAAGVAALGRLTADWGRPVTEVDTPAGVLHFKSDCSLLDEETMLSTERLAESGCFEGYRLIHTAEGEEAAANAIRVNDHVIMPSGFPKTAERLSAAGYEVREVAASEAAKLDGGVSCMSLRFSPAE